jgi:regulator of protease activity HflC (stomatin/prohibitin superfamily)
MFKERSAWSLPGIPTFLVLLAVAVGLGLLFFAYIGTVLVPAGDAVGGLEILGLILIVALFVTVLVMFAGLTPVNPNEPRALVFVGRYSGTIRSQGLHWVNPFTQRRRVSVRVRNFETAKLKVNDSDGNPIEIAAIVVWRVTDTAEALFEVDDYENFVQVQSESALRNLATSHPYDAHREGDVALRSNPAVIAARTRIVEGAVGMVEMALEQLSAKKVVELDEERKAQMVSNLLVVLCSEHETQPVINAGTLYA